MAAQQIASGLTQPRAHEHRYGCCGSRMDSPDMDKLADADLMSLEQYARERRHSARGCCVTRASGSSRSGRNAHLVLRGSTHGAVPVQEMLRIERIFEPQGIADELGAYNPLIPDGSNWKATLLIEFAQPEERARSARAPEGDRGWLLGAVAGHAACVRHCRRGSGARERGEKPRRCIYGFELSPA